jgi:hypothetical protein
MASQTSPNEPADTEKADTEKKADTENGEKPTPKGRARRRNTEPDPKQPDDNGGGGRTLSRPQQAELRRKLREKFH